MKIKKISTQESKGMMTFPHSALLFFAGWGMDEYPFMEYHPASHDFFICYDYHSLDFDESIFKSYTNIHVVAWSMGVWAASQVLKDIQLPITESIAVNGTPFPVHDTKGIPHSIFEGTLNGLNELTLRKFRRRMCGSQDSFNRFLEKVPQRDIEDLKEELKIIGEKVRLSNDALSRWDKVYIGTSDKIFVTDNQLNAWQGYNTCLIDQEHYAEDLWKELFR